MGRLLDETGTLPLLRIGEEAHFVLRALDIYGNPVQNISLSIYRGEEGGALSRVMTVRTGEDGRARFSLSFPTPGTWQVKAYFQAWELTWVVGVQDG